MSEAPALMPVADARTRIVEALSPLPSESVGIAEAAGRVLARDITARVTQPPVSVSAMDGYAVRAKDVATVPATLTQIGTAPAGAAFEGAIAAGECVRIFTGGPVPAGADAIVIQEDTETQGERITIKETAPAGKYIRPAGLDFAAGQVLLSAGVALGSREVGLAAAANVPWLEVTRKPRVALLATGDEIVRPGDPIGPNQIASSNALALAAMIRAHGGEALDLGIALDSRESLLAMSAGARGADLLITLGGASVGDHDLIQSVLGERGLQVDFWRIAMRPGKPLLFGRIGETPMLGLPGNPVSSLVCGLVFVVPALAKLLGRGADADSVRTVRLGRDLEPNDRRQDYLRARLEPGPGGETVAVPFEKQDSSMLRLLTESDCLVIRAPHAPAAKAGDLTEMIPLTGAPTL